VKPSRYAGISKRYADIQKNLDNFTKQNNPEIRQQRWSDYDKAEQERHQQQLNSTTPQPPTNTSGAINPQRNGRRFNNDEEDKNNLNNI